jgi:hypothetical protein
MSNRPQQLSEIQREALELFTNKNKDYGDSFATYGPIGVIVRIQDKISRLTSMEKNGITFVNTESIRDTLIDLHNYSAMAVMLLDEDNPDKKFKHKRILEIIKEEEVLKCNDELV